MLKINYKTILGIDISITGTGVCVISNDPRLGGKLIKNTRYKLLHTALANGKTKGKLTTYKKLSWTPEEGLTFVEDLGGAEGFTRGALVSDTFVNPLFTRFSITHACYEGYAFGGNGRVFDIAEFTLPIKNLLLSALGPSKLSEVKPGQLKKFFTGNGCASKEGQLYVAEKVYGLNFGDDNLADAFALAMYCAHYSKN